MRILNRFLLGNLWKMHCRFKGSCKSVLEIGDYVCFSIFCSTEVYSGCKHDINSLWLLKKIEGKNNFSLSSISNMGTHFQFVSSCRNFRCSLTWWEHILKKLHRSWQISLSLSLTTVLWRKRKNSVFSLLYV